MIDQASFRTALLDPALAVPTGLADPQGRPAGKRFDVYRNNVVASLIEALEASFPVVRKLVGDPFFKDMARLYLTEHPPSSPLLMFYGDRMPAFLATFGPTAHLGYLPDIARLELAIRQSYHAADATPERPDRLAELPPDQLDDARITLTPATGLTRSRWPIHAIWRANMVEGAPKPQMQAEDVLIVRPAFDPDLHLLPPGGGGFITALLAGRPLGHAADRGAETPGFDLSSILTLLIQNRAIHHITCEVS